MKKFFLLSFLLVSISSCKLIESLKEKPKDVYIDVLFAFGKPIVKDLLNLTELDFKKDTVIIEKESANSKIRKTLGQKIPNFLTQTGSLVLDTENVKAELDWAKSQKKDSTVIRFFYRKK
jgi:hypothetical protein